MNSPEATDQAVGRAPDTVRRVRKVWVSANQGKEPGRAVALYLTTGQGLREVKTLDAYGPDLLLVGIVGDALENVVLLLAPEACAFELVGFEVTVERPRVEIGFGAEMQRMG